MSAIIEELKLRNFEGYREAHVKFSAGLNLIKGRNSTGKSTLLDAIVYGIFGEAGVKPRLLFSRLPGSREMTVYVRFRSPRNGAEIEVFRKGRLEREGAYRTVERLLRVDGAEIPVEGDEDLRAKVTSLLGVSLRKFLSLIYVRQGKLTEILEPEKEQMDSVIGITLLRELREELDEARKALEKYDGRDAPTEAQNLEKILIPQLTMSLRELEKDVERLGSEVEGLREIVEKGESPELARLLEEIREREESMDRIQMIRAGIRELLRGAGVESMEELESKLISLNGKIEDLRVRKGEKESKVRELLDSWSTLKGKADSLEAQVKRHLRLLEEGIPKCPTCGQELNPSVLKRILAEDEAILQDLRRRGDEAKRLYEKEKEGLEKMGNELVALEGEASRLNQLKGDLKTYISSAEKYEGAALILLKAIGESLKKLGLDFEPDDPGLKVKVAQRLPLEPEELAAKRRELGEKEELLKRKTEESGEIRSRLDAYKGILDKLRHRIERAGLAGRLSRGFDQGVEARRREILKRIEFRALEYYKAMTDQHVYAAFTIDPEDYTAWVHPKGLTEPIPATRVGGGHQTIIAASIRLALLDVLGFRHLLILDEPTYGVDSENLPQLASYIGEASRQLSQMILVTHHDICTEEASNIINVSIAEDGGSKAETYS
ncbi:MAG: AAA family ATPase [Candidatus Bathyarchaeia archaeon]